MGISNVILLPSLLALVWYVLVIVGGFKMFKKANKPVFLIKFSIKTAKCYGFSVGFGILTLFFPFVCSLIMGFSSNRFAVVD